MAIDALARGMAAAAGGGGGGLDVGIDAGTGIRFTGTDPITIINTGVTAVTTPGDNDIAEDGTIKVANPGAENSADRVHYVKVKGINNAAFKDVDTVINDTKATSTNVPTTKAVYDELEKKLEADLDTTAFTNDNDHVPSSKLVKEKLDDKLEDSLTINGVSYNSNTDSYTLDGDDIDLTGYTPISSGAEEDVAATDSVNDAVAKVEYKADNRIPTANIDTDFPVTPDATHVLASTVASAEFKGTGTAGINPKKGLVPAPGTISGTETRFLKADGTWATPPNAEYTEGTGIDISNAGVISNTGVTHIENSDPADDNVGNGTFKVVENGTAKWIAIKGLDDAAYKDVDDAITSGSTSINLPTSQAVADYVDDAVSDIDATDINLTSNYAPASTASLPAASDPVQTAIGKLAKSVDANQNSISLLGADISFTINSSTYELTARLLNSDGDAIGTAKTVDLPLESMVVDADYDDTNKTIVLTLKNGQTTSFSVADLVSGLQTELSSTNKLNPAYIDYDASHRAVSDTEKGTWNGKQDVISDLETIRSGAAAGATAVQPATMSEALAAKQNSLSETQLAAVNSGITSEGVAQISTNQSNILYNMKNGVQNIAEISEGTGDYQTFFIVGKLAHPIEASGKVHISLSYTQTTANKTRFQLTDVNGSTIGNSIWFPNTSGSISQEYIVPANSTAYGYTVKNDSSTTTDKSTVTNLMICTPEAWAQNPNYQPPALPNSDLTRLESEDRAALADEIDAGAKNKFDLSTATFDTYGGTCSITYNSNSSATIKQVSGGTNLRLPGFVTRLEAGTYILSGCPSGGSDSTYRLDLRNYSGGSADDVVNGSNDYGSGSVSFTITTAGNYYIAVRFASDYTIPTAGITVRPMICTKADWDISHTYAPYALPNTTITPALIEQIDSGAKNLLETLASVTKTAGTATVTYTKDSNEYITASPTTDDQRTFTYDNRQYTVHLKPGLYVLMIDIKTASTSQYSSCMLVNTSNTVIASSGVLQNKTGVLSIEFSITTEGDYGIISKLFDGSWRIMICTLADWKVSQKYEPYRPSYENVAFGTQMYGNLTTSIINALPFGDTMGYINDSSVIPGIGNKYVVIHTYKCTSTGQTKIQVVESTDGKQYFRNYDGSSWSAWIPDARTAVKRVTTDGNQSYLGIIATHSSSARGALTMQFVSNNQSTDGAGIIDVVYYLSTTIANSKVYIRTATTGSVQVKCYQASNGLSLAIIFRAVSKWSNVSLIGSTCDFSELSNYASTNAAPDGYTEITPGNLT